MKYTEYEGQRVTTKENLHLVYVEDFDTYEDEAYVLRNKPPYVLNAIEEMVGTLVLQVNEVLKTDTIQDVGFRWALHGLVTTVNDFAHHPVFAARENLPFTEKHRDEVMSQLKKAIDPDISVSELEPIAFHGKQMEVVKMTPNLEEERYEWPKEEGNPPRLVAALLVPKTEDAPFEKVRGLVRSLGQFESALKVEKYTKNALSYQEYMEGKSDSGIHERAIHAFKKLLRTLVYFVNSTSANHLRLEMFDLIELDVKAKV